MKYLWNQFQNDQTRYWSATVSSLVGSYRNTSRIRMEVYYFLSYRITAVNTITLVPRDTAMHAASHTLSNKHHLPPFSNSCAKDHSTSLNFLSSFLQHCAAFCISSEPHRGPSKSGFLAHTGLYLTLNHMWSVHLLHNTIRTADLAHEFGYMWELYYQPICSRKHRVIRILAGLGS